MVFRDLLARETLAIPWRELLWAFRRMEARGTIRGGRFVTGFVGEQYALPGAVESLRRTRRIPRSGELVRVAARHLIVSYYHPAPLHRSYKRLRGHPKHALDLALLPRQNFLQLFEALGCSVLADRAVLPFVHANRITLLRKTAK